MGRFVGEIAKKKIRSAKKIDVDLSVKMDLVIQNNKIRWFLCWSSVICEATGHV